MNRRGFLRAAVATVALTTGLARTSLAVERQLRDNELLYSTPHRALWNDDALRKWYVEAQARAYADAREDAVYDAVYNALINSPS